MQRSSSGDPWYYRIRHPKFGSSEGGRPQTAWPIRGLWFVLIGWWASALCMALAWLVQLTVIGLPLAILMFNRTPFVASLYRY